MEFSRRTYLGTTGTLLTVGIAGCAGDAAPSVDDVDGDVAVGAGSQGFEFDPPELTIEVGETVVWEWTGAGGAHNVVATDESEIQVDPEEELLDTAGHTAEHTFTESGTYEYVCEPHIAQGMVGEIIVE